MQAQNSYRCSQIDLYLVCNEAIKLIDEHLPTLANVSTSFTPQLITDLKALVLAAESMPDNQARQSTSEVLRTQLVAAADKLLLYFRLLLLHIKSAFPATVHKTMFEAAGHKYYPDAANNSWDDCTSLILSANNFLNLHANTLATDGTMPQNFPADFALLAATFRTLHSQFITSTRHAEDSTYDKVTFNNNLYRVVMTQLEYGNIFFGNTPELSEKFTFQYLYRYITGVKAAGLKGIITNKATNRPVPNALITVFKAPNTSYAAVSNLDGEYDLSPIASGSYTLTCEATDFLTATFTKDVSVGTTSKFDISIEPAPLPDSNPANPSTL